MMRKGTQYSMFSRDTPKVQNSYLLTLTTDAGDSRNAQNSEMNLENI